MKRWFRFVFGIIILGLVIYVLKDIDFRELYLLLETANLWFVLLAFLSIIFTFFVWALRRTYSSINEFKGNFWFFLNVILAGAFFGLITPGAGVGGELARAHFMAKRYKQPKTKMLAYAIGDKFFQLIVLAFFGIFSVLFVLFYVNISNTLQIILQSVLTVTVIALIMVSYFIFKKHKTNIGFLFKKLHVFDFIKKRFKKPKDFEKYINLKAHEFLSIFRQSIKHKRGLFFGIFLSIIFWMLNYLSAYFIFLAFNQHVNFLSVIIVVTLGSIIADLSLFPGGVGFAEVSMTLLYSGMGIAIPLALLVALLTRIIYYIIALGIGGLSLLYVRKVVHEK